MPEKTGRGFGLWGLRNKRAPRVGKRSNRPKMKKKEEQRL